MEKDKDNSEGVYDKEKVNYSEIDVENKENSTEYNEVMVSKHLWISYFRIWLLALTFPVKSGHIGPNSEWGNSRLNLDREMNLFKETKLKVKPPPPPYVCFWLLQHMMQ